MPEYLKAVGYETVMLGKWHLGHFKHAHLPLQRGFDHHVGFYSGFQDYFTHVSESTLCEQAGACFLDLRDGAAAWDTGASLGDDEAAFAPALWAAAFATAAAKVASGGSSEGKPLFVYYAQSLVHEPLQAPASVYADNAAVLDGIPNVGRRTFAAMTLCLDAYAKDLTTTMTSLGLWDNTVLV
jgi:arylsulfatase A-like enzyme